MAAKAATHVHVSGGGIPAIFFNLGASPLHEFSANGLVCFIPLYLERQSGRWGLYMACCIQQVSGLRLLPPNLPALCAVAVFALPHVDPCALSPAQLRFCWTCRDTPLCPED